MHNSKLASSVKSDAIDWRSHFEAYKSQNISRNGPMSRFSTTKIEVSYQ